MDFGVTSKYSSSAKNSMQSSRLIIFGGVSLKASSELEERVFVRCLRLQTLTTISHPFGFMPTTMPA